MEFTTKMKALRILENEHMLLRHMMHDWFVVMEQANQLTKEAPLMLQITTLKTSLAEFLPILTKHQQKEEKFFFPILGSYIGTNQGPIVTIEAEHDEMLQYFNHFMANASLERSAVELKALLADLTEGYEILMVHMYKEESVLFPMAEKVFKIKDEEILLDAVNTSIV